MILGLLIFFGVGFAATCALLLRATRRLLQFDSIFGGILEELQSYELDLKKMSSGGLLQDHPEVLKFHSRNLKALRSLSDTIQQIVEMRAPQEPVGDLPRPDVE